MAVVERETREQELRCDLDRLKALVEASRVEEAQRLAPELAAKWPDSRAAQHWARVLEPPRILPTPPGWKNRSFDRETTWIRQHGHEYPGCWLGVYEDRLIAADPDLGVVIRAMEAEIGDEMGLLHHQGPAEP